MGTGKKATGKPLNIGAIVTVVPGVNWDEITDNARGYFDCVNDNGGIFNRPINFIVHVEPINPEHVAAFAKKLIEEEKVVAMVGNIDVMDCAVNAKYYASKKFYVIGDGVHDLCYGGTPHHIPINMGPAYSTLGAAQYLVRKGAKSVVVVSPTGVDAAGTWNKPAVDIRASRRASRPSTSTTRTPSQASYALKYVQLAGKGGGVILDYTTDQVLTVLKAAEQQGIANDVFWAASTPVVRHDASPRGRASSGTGRSASTPSSLLLHGQGAGRRALPRRRHEVREEVGAVVVRPVRLPRRPCRGGGDVEPQAEPAHRKGHQRGVLEDQELEERPSLQALLLRQPARTHAEQLRTSRPRGRTGRWCSSRAASPIAPVTPEIKAARAAERKLKLNSGTSFPKPAWLR